MDWDGCRYTVRNACLAINDAARSVDNHKILAAVEVREELSALLRQLAEIDDAAEIENLPENLMDILQLIAAYDLRIAHGQPGYSKSATAAVEQLNDARATLDLLRKPDVYLSAVANTHTAAKYRHQGLPLDQMRLGLRSHLARLLNAGGAMALPQDRTQLYESQRALTRRIDEIYSRLQRRVLGL